MNILIKNGRVIDPATKTDKISDLYIEAGKIKEIKDQKQEINRFIIRSSTKKIPRVDEKGAYDMEKY